MRRRGWLAGMAGMLTLPRVPHAAAPAFAPVVPGYALRFPHDEGAHPDFRTEWWYVTGWLAAAVVPLGFQVTFFRTRPHPDSGNPSRFAPRHILIAHAALSDPRLGRLRHAQRVARAGFSLAEARTGAMQVRLDDWHLSTGPDRYTTHIEAEGLTLDLSFRRTQPGMLQGDGGFSRKGPRLESASYYYSLPHLAVAGQVSTGKERLAVTGTAWLDHEWSSEYMDPAAAGWDWIGINLDDGAALMAFRMRGRDGGQLWAGAGWREPNGATRTFPPQDIGWNALRWWQSPRTGARYPVSMEVALADRRVTLEPLFDDQENDTRLSTGAVYWEGAVVARQSGQRIGRGYLELTGYAGALRMS